MNAGCRLFLIRHGQAENPDHEGRVHGYSDCALTERGRAQAQSLAGLLSSVAIDAAYSSDLARARETAEILVGDRVPMRIDPRLREVDIGDFEGMTLPLLRQVDRRFLPWLEIFLHGRFASAGFHIRSGMAFPGGESVESMMVRLLPALREVAARHQGETVVVVSHGYAIQALLCHVTCTDLSNYYRFAYANCALTVAEVREDARGVLLAHNGTLGLEVGGPPGQRVADAGAGEPVAPIEGGVGQTCRVLLLCADGVEPSTLADRAAEVRLSAIRVAANSAFLTAAATLAETHQLHPVVDHRMDDPETALQPYLEVLDGHLESTVAVIAGRPVVSLLGCHAIGAKPSDFARFPALGGSVGVVEVERSGHGMLHVWNGRIAPGDLDAVVGRSRALDALR